MKRFKFHFLLLLAAVSVGQALAAEEPNRDWPNLARYRGDNARIGLPATGETRVVFMGDSITDGWNLAAQEPFAGKSYVNRGISGQTTPQMLVRFRPEVIELQPKLVVILAGTNDIAGNTGPASIESIAGNLASMAELASVHGIKVVLCSVLPADRYYWIPTVKPAEQIVALNKLIRGYAERNGLVYLDYYTPMVNEGLGLKKEYSEDGVHPNAAGYKVMAALAGTAIQRALKAN